VNKIEYKQMKSLLIKGASVVGPDQVYRADVLVEDSLIAQINPAIRPGKGTAVMHARGKYVLPGFIDIHNHGSVGFDTSFGTYRQQDDAFDSTAQAYKNGLKAALDFYIRTGINKVLLTTMAAPLDQLCRALSLVRDFLEEQPAYRELVYGINLEGTFLKDPVYAGAQNPEYFYAAEQQVIDRLQEASGNLLKIVNLPPEHDEQGCRLTKDLVKNGIIVAGGHSAAFGDNFDRAVKAGLNVAVHFLNGPSRSSSKGFRGGGAVEAMLRSDKVYLEVICDGYHVAPAYVRDIIARKGHERVVIITDSMFANGLSGLERFELLGLKGAVSSNKKYLQVLGKENTLFGSVLTADTGYGNMVLWLTTPIPGIWHRTHQALSLHEALVYASVMYSANPARLLGIFNKHGGRPGCGSVEVGKSADLLVADVAPGEFSLAHNILGGKVYTWFNK